MPVGETPYAKDATFGYKNSDLKLWIEEKTKGKIKANEVISFDPNTVEEQNSDNIGKGVDFILKKMKKLPDNKILIVNALTREDLEIFSLAALRSERRIIYRTGASFVTAFAGIVPKPLWTPTKEKVETGGLIIVGSHVPKTTAQLNELLKTDIESLELDVSKFIITNFPKV